MIRKILPVLILGVIVVVLAVMRTEISGKKTTQKKSETQPSNTKAQPRKSSVIGWVAYWDEQNTLNTLEGSMQYFSEFSPILYKIDSDGSLAELNVTTKEKLLSLARQYNVPVIPVIGDDFDYKRVNMLLRNSTARQKFINQMILEAKNNNYAGWSIDIETLEKKDAAAFTDFVRDVAAGLNKNELSLNMILYARDASENLDAALAQDYQEVGRASDKVTLMAYGYHNSSTAPGGQAPTKWYRSMLKYATTNIPPEKLNIGLSTHGYVWGGKEVEGITHSEVKRRIMEHSANPTYNTSEASSFAKYKIGNTVYEIWYEDSQTIAEKMRIAREEFGVYGFAIWRVGAEDPEMWKKIPTFVRD